MEETETQAQAKPKSSAVPRSCYIEFTLPESEWKKLRRWLDNHDVTELATGSGNRAYLFNRSQLGKLRAEASTP